MSKKKFQHFQRIESLVSACFGAFILYWTGTSYYHSRVHKILDELVSSNDAIWYYSTSMVRTGIITESEYYRVYNWGFPLLILLGVLLIALMHTVSRPKKESSCADKVVEVASASNNDNEF